MLGIFRGATELILDANDRLNLPKNMDFAGLDKEVVLAHGNKIEVWSKDRYNDIMEDEPLDFADLAEEVMGNINNQTTTTTLMNYHNPVMLNEC